MEKAYKRKIIYDLAMGILALIVVFMILIEISIEVPTNILLVFSTLDCFIWIIFCIDYFTRLYISKNKFNFIKSNIIDLISIIPLNSIFKTLKVIKIIKLNKLLKLSKLLKVFIFLTKFKSKINSFLRTNNFNYVIYLTIATVLAGAIGISITEKMEFANALWWSFVTTTTVGYGDISPETIAGRIIAVILMLIGIGFIGMLTGTIATFFLNDKNENKGSYKDSIVNDAKTKLDNFDSLSKEDLKHMFNVLERLKD